jgi:hypothetical protein
MANVSVNFERLKGNHPSYKSVRSLLDGIPGYVDETCTVQLSYALNQSNAVIQNYDYPDPTLATGKVRVFQGGDGLSYIFAVPDMKVYLNKTCGDAENFRGTQLEITNGITGRNGILAFGHRHIDLWDGDNVHRPSMYNMAYLWTCPSIRLRGAFFWEITSELGF